MPSAFLQLSGHDRCFRSVAARAGGGEKAEIAAQLVVRAQPGEIRTLRTARFRRRRARFCSSGATAVALGASRRVLVWARRPARAGTMAICVGRNVCDGTSVIAERQDPPRGRGAQRGPRKRKSVCCWSSERGAGGAERLAAVRPRSWLEVTCYISCQTPRRVVMFFRLPLRVNIP